MRQLFILAAVFAAMTAQAQFGAQRGNPIVPSVKAEVEDTITYSTLEVPFFITFTVNKGGFFEFTPQAGLYLSHLDASRTVPAVTEKVNSNTVRFTYRGAKGQQVRLGGSFTNWDSWIYTLTETSPGVYEIDIPLAPGKYEYAFYTGIQSTPDPSNPERVYTADGRIASLLIVQ